MPRAAAKATSRLSSHWVPQTSHRRRETQVCGDRVYSEVSCVDSEPDDCIHMGDTKPRHPVDITRSVAEADFRIGVGNIEFHYFAGYSGGAKALMPESLLRGRYRPTTQ